MSYVIAIAAPIGGGKTSFVEALAGALEDTATMHFDRYEIETKQPVSRLVRWMKRGADFSAFEAPNLAQDLKNLRDGRPVVDPLTRTEVPPAEIILFEMPLGREHAETAPYIDFVIWIDVPLDIALARKIREYIAWFREEKNPDGWMWLDNFVANYLQVFREVLLLQGQRVSSRADLVLDGREAPETLLHQALEAIRKWTQ